MLAGARMHRLDGVGHMGLVHSPEAWQFVQEALASSFRTPRRI
jgi:triacylglycerol lipase